MLKCCALSLLALFLSFPFFKHSYTLIRKSATKAISDYLLWFQTIIIINTTNPPTSTFPFPPQLELPQLPWIIYTFTCSLFQRNGTFVQQHIDCEQKKKISNWDTNFKGKKKMFKTLLATTLVGSAIAADVVLEDFSNPYVVVLSLSRFVERDRRTWTENSSAL